MSTFLNSLINLGEEEEVTTTAGNANSQEERSKMSVVDLNKLVTRLEDANATKQRDYDELRNDSQKLQSEYEAHKRKVSGWQRQMKEQRATDKKMIEDLRAAGATGKTDDVFVKQTTETITGLKESLREAHEETERAYKKQREAEQQRVSIDDDRKRELEELNDKFVQFKESNKQQQDKNLMLIEELRQKGSTSGQSEALKSQLDASERKRAAAQTRLRSLEEEVLSLRQQQQQQQSSSSSGDPNSHNQDGDPTSDEDGGSANTPERNRITSPSTAMTPSTVVSALEAELSQSSTLLQAANIKEAEATERVRKMEDRLQRLQEDVQWDSLQAEKKLSESKSVVESWKTKYAMLESKIETTSEEHIGAEKTLRKALRDTEDSLAQEKDIVATLQREIAEKKRRLEDMEQVQREDKSQRETMVGEVEEATKKTTEALDTQRSHFEDRQRELEAQLQRAYSQRESLEAAQQEMKVDLRHREDTIDDLRRELSNKAAVCDEVEEQLAASQRALNEREEDLLDRERERHRVRSQLREEEDNAAKLASTIAELQDRLAENEHELRLRDAGFRQLETDSERAKLELVAATNALQESKSALQAKERHVAELSSRLKDQGVRNADIVKIREDQAAKVRYYESRVMELQEELRLAPSKSGGSGSGQSGTSTAAGGSSGGSGGQQEHVAVQFPRAFNVPIQYGKGLSWRQLKYLITGTVFFILFISIFNTFSYGRTTKDDETISILREKYGQSLAAATTCRESLSDAKEKLLQCTTTAKGKDASFAATPVDNAAASAKTS